jgi:hypothetical protein
MNGFEEGYPCLGQSKENLSLQMANKLPDPNVAYLSLIFFCFSTFIHL